MDTGRLRERIVLEQTALTEDGVGGLVPGAPVIVATVWAALDVQGGREFPELAGRTVAEVDVVWTVRHRTDVVAKTMLVNHRGTRYDIEGVLPDPERVWLRLLCKRRET
jgi:SPP1 family predicted phage head-tail adaptor